MGLYGSAPKAPDPKETAAAQTSTNVSTAIANNWLGNINQVTPDGSLTYSQTGQQFINDKNGQKYYYNPTTGEYSQTAPKGTTTQTQKTYISGYNGNGHPIYSTKTVGTNTPAKGWQQVTGYYVPTMTATTTLSQQQQKIKDQEDAASLNLATLANNQSGRLNDLLSTNLNLDGLPEATDYSAIQAPEYERFGVDDFSADRQKVEDALMARLNPQLSQDRAALEQRLTNQGLVPGSEAYNRAIDEASRASNDARLGAILSAGQEQSRLQDLSYRTHAGNNALQDQTFNAAMSKGSAQDNSRNRALQERLTMRNQPINEIASLMSGAQVSMPNFMNVQGAQLPTVDYAGLVQQNYANEMGAYQQNQANIGGLLGGLGSILSLSDDRTKKNKKKLGKVNGKMNLWEFNYKNEPEGTKPHVGLMASEVEKEKPSAVERKGGIRFVNYKKALGA